MNDPTTSKPAIYIAGPMTGYPDWNFPAFADAAKVLRGFGWAVINPGENIGGDTEQPSPWYMRLDLGMILAVADAIALLPGWRESRGARTEAAVAQAIGIDIYEVNLGDGPYLVPVEGIDFKVKKVHHA